MTLYTVQELAKLAGVSVRALHHYDQIGLLRPGRVGENRYRYYGRAELERLQQILIHKALGMRLTDIAAVLDAPGFDRLSALLAQRDRLAREAERFAAMVETIDKTIETLKGNGTMSDADLYSGIVDPQKQAEYEQWLIERYGGDMPERIAVSKRKYADMSEADRQALGHDLQELETALADAMRNGVPPQARALAPLLDRHRQWVATMWDKPCPPEAYSGLADLYLSHPDFRARYEQIGTGFTDYLTTAMKNWAKQQEA